MFLLCGCEERGTPMAPASPVTTPLLPPAEGVLRLTKKAGLPEDLKGLSPDLPVLNLQVDYVGPKRWLEIDAHCCAGGKYLSDGENYRRIELPLSGSIVIGFGEGKTLDGAPDATVLESTPAGTGVLQFGAGPLRGHRITTWESPWPCELRGPASYVWGVFVDEADGAALLGPTDRVSRARAGWVFWIRMGHRRLTSIDPVVGDVTRFQPIGGRQMRSFHCTLDLATGKAIVVPAGNPESPPGDGERESLVEAGQRYRVVLEDNSKDLASKAGMTGLGLNSDRVQVSVEVSSESTRKVIRSLPVQEFQGNHEEHVVRSLKLKDGTLTFWIQFWTLE